MDCPRPKVLDARYTHTGRYSAWLLKTKSDSSKAKWLNSKCSRFFTIDFDSHLFRYSSSDINKDLSVKIRFHEIVRAELVQVKDSHDAESTPTGGLRRSFSSLLHKGSRPLASVPGPTAFKVFFNEKFLELTAESRADAQTWVDMLNSAVLLGQEQATSAGGSASSSNSGQTTPSAAAWCDQHSNDGSTQPGPSDLSGSRPESSASTSLPPLQALAGGGDEASRERQHDETAIEIEVVDLPRDAVPEATSLGQETLSWWQQQQQQEEQQRQPEEGLLLQLQQQQQQQEEELLQQQQQEQQEQHAPSLQSFEGEIGHFKKLQATDFGFDDEALQDGDIEVSEDDDSPVVTPRLASCPAPLDCSDAGSDSDRDDAPERRSSRLASDLKLVARRLADAEEGSHRKTDISEKKRAKAKRKQQEREARIAADLLLAQSVRGGGQR